MNLNTVTNEAVRVIQAVSRVTNIPLYKPSNVTLDLTDRCQLKCQTCSKWKTNPDVISNELSTDDWKKIIAALEEWLGPFWFTFSGGEPLLRPDIFELIRYAAQLKTLPTLITNGYGFRNLAEKIVDSDVKSVVVSLNGINPDTHDTTRGVGGAFQKTEEFITELNQARKRSGKTVKLSLNTILLPINYMEAPELVDWVQEEGLDGVHFQPMDPPGCFHASPITGINTASLEGAGGNWYMQTLEKTNSNLKSTISKLVTMKKNGAPILNTAEDLKKIEDYYSNPYLIKNKCKIGVSSFSVDPYGYVRCCFNMGTIGNIKDEAPKNIFTSQKAQQTRLQIKRCARPCHWAVFS